MKKSAVLKVLKVKHCEIGRLKDSLVLFFAKKVQDFFEKTVKKTSFYEDFKYFLQLKKKKKWRTKMSTQRLLRHLEMQSILFSRWKCPLFYVGWTGWSVATRGFNHLPDPVLPPLQSPLGSGQQDCQLPLSRH